MKKLVLLLAVALCVAGCTTFKNFFTPDKVRNLTKTAVYVAAAEVIKKNPTTKEAFTRALAGLDKLVTSKNWNITALYDSLLASGTSLYSGEKLKTLVTAAITLVELAFDDKLDLSKQEVVEAIITGADEGLSMALK